MDISEFKEALGDEAFAKLEGHVNELISQRDQARNESISGRKTMKQELETLKTERAQLMEKLGVESFDDIEELADAPGQAEAAKQFESKIKRLERELSERDEKLQAADKRFRDSQRQIHVSQALQKHEFIAPDLVESHLGSRLEWEGDDLFYKTDDGKLVSVADGVAELAKARPELLKPSGARGAGVGSRGAGGAEGRKEMSRAEFEALPPDQKVELSKNGVQLH